MSHKIITHTCQTNSIGGAPRTASEDIAVVTVDNEMGKISTACASVLVALVLAMTGMAQDTDQAKIDALQRRLTDLESQLQTVVRELAALKASSQMSPAKDTTASVPSTTARATTVDSPAKPPTTPPVRKDLGIDIGSARLTPYGTIYFNAFGNTGPTNNIDVPLWATQAGSGNFSSTVRQTRLGLKLEGAKVGDARLGAVVEADFFGGSPGIGIGENFGVVRLRLANVRVDWEKTSLTVGQDWMVFAPQNPTSLAAAAIPQMTSAGNNWARLPQVKLQRKFGEHLTWQAAVLAPQTGDSPTTATFLLQPNSGAASLVPFLQSRISFGDNNWFGTAKLGVVGISGHYGRSRVFTGAANIENDIDSVGVAADWSFPLAKRVTFSGEAFFGRNLGGFQAGIFQSYNNEFAYRVGTSLVPGGVRSIATRGGWMQIGFTPPVWNDRLGIFGSVGIDDPEDRDLVTLSNRDWRTQNVAVAGNFIYRFTPQFSIAGEIRRFQTNYFRTARRNANHLNFAAAYSF